MGGSRPRNPLLSGESDPVAESCGRAARPLAAATGARDCAPPAVAGARGAPLRSTNPATTGCPKAAAGCRRLQPCESRGEWRGHSSGRRVPEPVEGPRRYRPLRHRSRRHWQRSTNPATTGCPAARRACALYLRIDYDQDYDDDQDCVGFDKARDKARDKA